MPIWVLDAGVLGEPKLKSILFSCSILQTRDFCVCVGGGDSKHLLEKNVNMAIMFIIQGWLNYMCRSP